MLVHGKPATLRASSFRQKIKANVFSSYLRRFPAAEKTLDIGCGWGFSLLINPNFVCVDADEDCIRHLQSQGADAHHADVSKPLPFDANSFDNAFTHDVLEHLDENEMLALFSDVRRILRAGGSFMNIVPNHKGYIAGIDPAVGHKRFVTESEVMAAATATGFKLVESWHTPLPKIAGAWFTHNKLVTICQAV